jgi:UDP-glucose:(heptosyl)LPS alpha-1,3-glucosyltransferase
VKFLFALFKYFPFGGLQKDTLRFAEEALSRGHQPAILTTAWDGPPPPEGVEVLFTRARGWSNHARMENFARDFQQAICYGDYDASLAMNRIPGADLYFVADSCMTLWMHKKHSALLLALHPRYRTFLRHEAQLCAPDSPTKLLCIAPIQQQEYKQAYNLPDDRLLYLPPGMDPRCRRPADDASKAIRRAKRAELGLGENDIAVIQVGTGLWRKGVDRTMQALAAASAQGHKVRLLLAGGEKPATVGKLAERSGLAAEAVFFLGPRHDVPELLLASDLMVHPAREEGTGTVLIEALAAGLPVICTDVCGFAPFVAQATATTVPEPFSQERLNQLLLQSLSRLPQLASDTHAFANTQDFCSRSAVAVDFLEQAGKARQNANTQ